MNEAFFAFVEDPAPENFLAFRSQIVNDPAYDAYSDDLREMEAALESKQFSEVGTIFRRTIPNLMASPRAHMLLGIAGRESGNAEVADAEKFLCFRCVDGILGTGDGTRERPYLVTRTSDEYDTLLALGKQLGRQALIHDAGRSFDVITCDDGSEVYFDITDAFQSMARCFGASS